MFCSGARYERASLSGIDVCLTATFGKKNSKPSFFLLSSLLLAWLTAALGWFRASLAALRSFALLLCLFDITVSSAAFGSQEGRIALRRCLFFCCTQRVLFVAPSLFFFGPVSQSSRQPARSGRSFVPPPTGLPLAS